MSEGYERRQLDRRRRAGEQSQLTGVPGWYVELLAGVAGDLTAWHEHDPGQYLDPRCDPRYPGSRARYDGYCLDPWTERRKAEVLQEIWAADRAMREKPQSVNRLRLVLPAQGSTASTSAWRCEP